jgi:hypothetical protein
MFLRLSFPFYGVFYTHSGVWKHVSNVKQEHSKRNTIILFLFIVLKWTKHINVIKTFTQNYIAITRWQQIGPSMPQRA